MAWETIGDFLGRDVRVQRFPSGEFFDIDDSLASSMVLLVSSGASFEPGGMRTCLAKLLSSAPLGVVFAGSDSRVAFDMTLELQSRVVGGPHTMTKLSGATDPVEAIEDFLHAAWPAEDRLDDWKLYSVLILGEAGLGAEIREAIAVALR